MEEQKDFNEKGSTKNKSTLVNLSLAQVILIKMKSETFFKPEVTKTLKTRLKVALRM